MSRTKRTIPPDIVARLKSRGYYDDSQELFFILANDGCKRDLNEKGFGPGYKYEGVTDRKGKKLIRRYEHHKERRKNNKIEMENE